MKQMSKGEAVRELTIWSKSSLVGLSFSRSDAAVNMSLRRAKMEVREPGNLFFEVAGSGAAMLNFADETKLSLVSAEEFAAEFSRLKNVVPAFDTALFAVFANKDFCFIFSEAPFKAHT